MYVIRNFRVNLKLIMKSEYFHLKVNNSNCSINIHHKEGVSKFKHCDLGINRKYRSEESLRVGNCHRTALNRPFYTKTP